MGGQVADGLKKVCKIIDIVSYAIEINVNGVM